MGFDLHGLNPVNNSNMKRPEIDWDLNPSKEETEEYFELKNKFDDKVPGSYFRNNVWWWRPLWDCISNICSDVLTKKDMEMGRWNDGHIISNKKSKAIAKRIHKLVENGFLIQYESDYKKEAGSEPRYPFDKENMLEFAKFCEQSGGFKIW